MTDGAIYSCVQQLEHKWRVYDPNGKREFLIDHCCVVVVGWRVGFCFSQFFLFFLFRFGRRCLWAPCPPNSRRYRSKLSRARRPTRWSAVSSTSCSFPCPSNLMSWPKLWAMLSARSARRGDWPLTNCRSLLCSSGPKSRHRPRRQPPLWPHWLPTESFSSAPFPGNLLLLSKLRCTGRTKLRSKEPMLEPRLDWMTRSNRNIGFICARNSTKWCGVKLSTRTPKWSEITFTASCISRGIVNTQTFASCPIWTKKLWWTTFEPVSRLVTSTPTSARSSSPSTLSSFIPFTIQNTSNCIRIVDWASCRLTYSPSPTPPTTPWCEIENLNASSSAVMILLSYRLQLSSFVELLLLLLYVFCSVVLSWRSKIERSFAAVFKFFIMERMLMDPYPLSFCFGILLLTWFSLLYTEKNAIGESGSGKTESTNFLLHHLTALSQKGSQGCGVEQTILSAGPVLEVTKSRFIPLILYFCGNCSQYFVYIFFLFRLIDFLGKRERLLLLVNRFNHQRQLVSYFWLWNGRQLSLKSIVPPTKERKKKRSPSRTVPTESSIEGAAALWHEFLHLACVWTERHNSAPLNLHTLFWNVNDGLNVLMLWPGFKEKRNEKKNKTRVWKKRIGWVFARGTGTAKWQLDARKLNRHAVGRNEWLSTCHCLFYLWRLFD